MSWQSATHLFRVGTAAAASRKVVRRYPPKLVTKGRGRVVSDAISHMDDDIMNIIITGEPR
jgi:hypothetical protein